MLTFALISCAVMFVVCVGIILMSNWYRPIKTIAIFLILAYYIFAYHFCIICIIKPEYTKYTDKVYSVCKYEAENNTVYVNNNGRIKPIKIDEVYYHKDKNVLKVTHIKYKKDILNYIMITANKSFYELYINDKGGI